MMDEKPEGSASTQKDLGARIAKAQEKYQKSEKVQEPVAGAGVGMRMAIEMVAAIGVSVYIGYWLDKGLNTKPLFLLVMFFLGVITGFWGVYRTAKRLEGK